ncbi:MAG: hypothetical protein PVJ51_10585, partial [Acidobacteriota bacterium]
MALRLVEVTLPRAELDGLPGLLEEVTLVDLKLWDTDGNGGMARILLDAQYTETVSDLLVDRYGSRDDFRIVLLAVEATVPQIEQPEEEKKQAQAEGEGSESKGPQRVSREELYEDLSEASGLTWVYVVMVALSTVVAAVGLTRG